MKKNLVVAIDWAGSLYDPEASEFMDKIEAALASAPPGGTVILQANIACHDYHRGWFDGVSSKYYWEDLAAHFQRVHLALIGICLSKARWFFISSNDCLGSWWDLAVSLWEDMQSRKRKASELQCCRCYTAWD